MYTICHCRSALYKCRNNVQKIMSLPHLKAQQPPVSQGLLIIANSQSLSLQVLSQTHDYFVSIGNRFYPILYVLHRVL